MNVPPGIIWIKYGWEYESSTYIISVRIVPKSSVSFYDLDQVVAAIGGGLALVFSLIEAFKERSRAKAGTGTASML